MRALEQLVKLLLANVVCLLLIAFCFTLKYMNYFSKSKEYCVCCLEVYLVAHTVCSRI